MTTPPPPTPRPASPRWAMAGYVVAAFLLGVGVSLVIVRGQWTTARMPDRPFASRGDVPSVATRPEGWAAALTRDDWTGLPAASRPAKALPGTVIDLNTAPADELQTLPGVGAVLAGRIVEERSRRPFERVDDLRRVQGVGAKTLERLRPFVRAGGPTPTRSATRPER